MQTFAELSLEEIQKIVATLEQAIRDHNQWLMAWHRTLVCKLPPDENTLREDSFRHCNFGQWYYHRAHPLMKTFPVFQQMELVHALMHTTAQSLLIKSFADGFINISEYDTFLSYRGEFREMVNLLESSLLDSLHNTDPLTRVLNRQSMIPRLLHVWERMAQGESVVLCMTDIDHFKKVNDTHGHLAGDKVLAEFASFLSINLRPSEVLFRYGGEEFLICLQETTLTTGLKVMERLRQSLAHQIIVLPAGTPLNITCSFGLAAAAPDLSLEQVVHMADKALYVAKRGGRNQVVAYLDEEKYLSPNGEPIAPSP